MYIVCVCLVCEFADFHVRIWIDERAWYDLQGQLNFAKMVRSDGISSALSFDYSHREPRNQQLASLPRVCVQKVATSQTPEKWHCLWAFAMKILEAAEKSFHEWGSASFCRYHRNQEKRAATFRHCQKKLHVWQGSVSSDLCELVTLTCALLNCIIIIFCGHCAVSHCVSCSELFVAP